MVVVVYFVPLFVCCFVLFRFVFSSKRASRRVSPPAGRFETSRGEVSSGYSTLISADNESLLVSYLLVVIHVS